MKTKLIPFFKTLTITASFFFHAASYAQETNAPDLTIGSIEAPSQLVYGYDNYWFDIFYTMRNNSSVGVTDFSTNLYFSTDTILSQDDYLAVHTGLYRDTVVSENPIRSGVVLSGQDDLSQLPDGDYYMILVVDPENNIQESNEENNSCYYKIRVESEKIDLFFQNVQIPRTRLEMTGDINISAELHNTGNSYVYDPYMVVLLSKDTIPDLYNDYYLGFLNCQTIPAGGFQKFTADAFIPSSIGSGTFYILFIADPGNIHPEINETNNMNITKVELIIPDFDLTIQTPSLSASKIVAGTSDVIATCSVVNSGTYSSIYFGGTMLNYYLSKDTVLDKASDILLDHENVPYVGPQSSVQFSSNLNNLIIPPQTAGGTYYLLFNADADSTQLESNEYNNITALPFTVVTCTRDLSLINPSLSKTNLKPEDNLTGKVSVSNSGNLDAAYWNIVYYLSNDAVLSPEDVYLNSTFIENLAAGSSGKYSTPMTIPSNTPNGKYFIICYVDPDNNLYEINENNNSWVKAVTVKHSSAREAIDSPEDTVAQKFEAAVAPNPVGENITVYIKGATSESLTVTILNMIGNEVLRSSFATTGDPIRIPSSVLSAGVYILKIESGNQVNTVLILKE